MFLSYFFAGSLIYFYRDKIINQEWRTKTTQDRHSGLDLESPNFDAKLKPTPYLILLLSSFALILSIYANQLSIFGPFSISLITIILGYKLPFQKLPKFLPDISYGVYIYGWLTQLLIIRYLRDYLNYQQYISLVLILTAAFGYGSYWIVERRFLKK